jgi:hypothetical protein
MDLLVLERPGMWELGFQECSPVPWMVKVDCTWTICKNNTVYVNTHFPSEHLDRNIPHVPLSFVAGGLCALCHCPRRRGHEDAVKHFVSL